MSHRDNASTTHCPDAECHGYDLCCAEDHVCTTMECPDHYDHREDVEFLHCAGEICDPAVDKDTCCKKRETCEMVNCPAGKLTIPNPHQTPCRNATCDDA